MTEVLEDSSGNGGSAIAAYAASPEVFARQGAGPALDTSPAKILQMRAYGADVEAGRGFSRNAISNLRRLEAVRQSQQIFYASHNWQPSSSKAPSRLLLTNCGRISASWRPTTLSRPFCAGSLLLGLHYGLRRTSPTAP